MTVTGSAGIGLAEAYNLPFIQSVEATRDELGKLEKRLEAEKTQLAQSLREGLEGAKEAGIALPEVVRGKVESAVSGIKLNMETQITATRVKAEPPDLNSPV